MASAELTMVVSFVLTTVGALVGTGSLRPPFVKLNRVEQECAQLVGAGSLWPPFVKRNGLEQKCGQLTCHGVTQKGQ